MAGLAAQGSGFSLERAGLLFHGAPFPFPPASHCGNQSGRFWRSDLPPMRPRSRPPTRTRTMATDLLAKKQSEGGKENRLNFSSSFFIPKDGRGEI